MTARASTQVSSAVQAALAPAARYTALVVQASPGGTAEELLARPDVSAELAAALEAARQAAAAVVQQQWDAAGAPDVPVRAQLLADVDRQYGDIARLRHAIGEAYGLVPPARRAAAVRAAILAFARQTALRSRLTVTVASQAAVTARVLADGRARAGAGEKVAKRWRARRDGKACYWCRKLDGTTIGLEESFLPYLGGPVDLAGHGRLTQPPRPYRGELQGPPLHPHCRCRLEIVLEDEPALPPLSPASPGFISAAQIRALPEQRYRALAAFLRAAVRELGAVLRRLAEL